MHMRICCIIDCTSYGQHSASKMDSGTHKDLAESTNTLFEGKPELTMYDVRIMLGRLNAMEAQLKAMQHGFNRIQAGIQPLLSRTGACSQTPAQ